MTATQRGYLKWFCGLAMAVLIGTSLLLVPEWIVNQYGGTGQPLTRNEYSQLVNSYRATLAQIIGGLVVLVGLYYTARNTRPAEDGRITERFSKAVDLLGSGNDAHKQVESRLSGMYALERLARDSDRDRSTVIEILSAYVRHNAPRKWMQVNPETGEPIGPEPERSRPSADIEAALEILRRRPVLTEADRQLKIDLNQTELYEAQLNDLPFDSADLSLAYLSRASLQRASLKRADLSRVFADRVNLASADLSGAILYRAKLQRAEFFNAKLLGTNFAEANLSMAKFKGARFGSQDGNTTNFRKAVLNDADLRGVDLRHVLGLSRKQINSAKTDHTTLLPDLLVEDTESDPEAEVSDESEIG